MKQQYLFFDSAATTPCCNEALKKLFLFTETEFGNPSSNHHYGVAPSQAITQAKEFFAQSFGGIDKEQVIFTGSGTEADNLAITGPALNAFSKNPSEFINNRKNIIISAIEHPAVSETAQSLKPYGIDVQIVPVNSKGQVETKELVSLINENTYMVSIMHVNNILGSVSDIKALAAATKEKNPHTLFHTDAIQSFGKIDIPVENSKIDLISISSHKVYGPKGVGALIILNKELQPKIKPIIYGGGQQENLRSGTESPGLISAFHIASKKALNEKNSSLEKALELKNHFIKQLKTKKLIKSNESNAGVIEVNSNEECIPYIVNLSFPGFPSSALIKLLEERGIIASVGSACSSKKQSKENALTHIGVSQKSAQSSIRFSFTKLNTTEEIEQLSLQIENCIDRMKKLLGYN